jgi:hypothetical protein
MKLTFYWPNNNTIQDNEFLISDYSYTQCYYNGLRPADNYVSVSIPWDTETANKLRLLKDDNIKVVITSDGGLPVFTGYIDDGVDFTKTQKTQPVGLKLVNQSFLLHQTIGETFSIKNKTVSQIITELLTRLEIAYSGAEVASTIPIVVIDEDEEYYDVIDTLLFEYGYTFDFDNTGRFVVLPVFNQPPNTITSVFDGSNIRNSVRQTVNKKQYNYIKVKFNEISINPNDLVYNDGEEKEVDAGLYFGHEEELGGADPDAIISLVDSGAIHCEYTSAKGKLVWADVVEDNFTVKTSPVNSFVIEKTGTLTGDVKTYLGNRGTSFAFRARNNTRGKASIKEIKAVGMSYTGITNYEISKNGNLLYEYESKYLQNKSDAAAFTRNISNYYRYSSIKLSLDSYIDYPYGSFVTVSENGIGTIKARIVRKTCRLNNPVSYELESVTDFTPASITGESTWGNNTTNNAQTGPDITPPTAPGNLTLSLRDDGKVIGSFTASTDIGGEVNSYSVFRKTPDMPYKTVLILNPDTTSFVDESGINGMNYTYRVIATDNSGNVSNPSNEVTIGTVVIDRPYAPATASANAFNDYIALSIIPPELAQDNRDIFTPSEYRIQISRDGGKTYSDVAVISNTNYDYYFNRQTDGYPEPDRLIDYRFRIYSVNIYGNISAGAVTCNVSMGDYITWVPVTPSGFTGESTGRTLYLDWNRQSIYGTLVYRIQISKDNSVWYKPNITDDPYASENNWKTGNANGFLEVTVNSFYQTVPLKGQNTDLGSNRYVIEPATYYYRVAAANTETGYATSWTGSISLTAEGTSAQDILKNSIGWDQIIPRSILVDKLGVKQLIAGECTLAFIANDIDVSDRERQGFQYWALDTITIPYNGKNYTFNKGEFRINAGKEDYFKVIPGTDNNSGIYFKASRIEIEALGSKVYGNFSIIDSRTDIRAQLFFDLLEANGNVKATPVITIGNAARKPVINVNGSVINVNGKINIETPPLPWFAG